MYGIPIWAIVRLVIFGSLTVTQITGKYAKIVQQLMSKVVIVNLGRVDLDSMRPGTVGSKYSVLVLWLFSIQVES